MSTKKQIEDRGDDAKFLIVPHENKRTIGIIIRSKKYVTYHFPSGASFVFRLSVCWCLCIKYTIYVVYAIGRYLLMSATVNVNMTSSIWLSIKTVKDDR